MITELQNYSWQRDKQTGEYINKPIDAFNHCIDAWRYSLQCVMAPKLKTISKQMLGV
jgi:phage terminase large subunit